MYAAGRLQIRDSKVQAAQRKACYQRANLTEAAQSADYRSRGDRPEAMGDVHGDCATVQPRSRRRIVDPTFPLKIPSGYVAAFGLCGFSSAVSLPYLTLPYLDRVCIMIVALAVGGTTRLTHVAHSHVSVRQSHTRNDSALTVTGTAHTRPSGPQSTDTTVQYLKYSLLA